MSDFSASAEPGPDPLKGVADALEAAVEAAKQGATDARETAHAVLPVAANVLSNLVYKVSYGVSYGVVFPAVLLARSLPQDNPVSHGLLDGARAAIDMVDEMKGKAPAPHSPILDPSGDPVSLSGQD